MTIIRGGLIGSIGGAGGGGGGTQLDLSAGLACYTQSFSGVTTTSISHNLGTEYVVVELKDSLGNLLVPNNWQVINPNVIDFDFGSPTQGDVTIIGCIASGIGAAGGGVTLLEGLSGIIDLDSTNNSINIVVNGQVIELNAIFTPASGAVLEQKCRDIDTLSGLINRSIGVSGINDVSGYVTLISPDESININVNGQNIELTTPTSGAPSGASYILVDYNDNGHLTDARVLSATSGIRLYDQGARSTSGIVISLDFDNEPQVNQVPTWNGQKLEWANQTGTGGISKAIRDFTPTSGNVFILEHGLETTDFIFNMWATNVSPQRLMLPNNVYPSGSNHAVIILDVPISGKIIFMG